MLSACGSSGHARRRRVPRSNTSASCFAVGKPPRPSLGGDAIHRLVVSSNSHSWPPSPSPSSFAISFSPPQDCGPRAGGFDAGLRPQGGPTEPASFSCVTFSFFVRTFVPVRDRGSLTTNNVCEANVVTRRLVAVQEFLHGRGRGTHKIVLYTLPPGLCWSEHGLGSDEPSAL